MQFIPQGPPFEMVDAIVSTSNEATRTQFLITESNIFTNNEGFLSEAALTENMAQTAAAHTGYIAHQQNELPPVGFIGAIKNLIVHQLPKVGDTIFTDMQFITQIGNVHIVQTTITCNNQVVASAEFKIFLQENNKEA